MRNVISHMHVSLDGYAAGPNGEMDWIIVDEEIFRDTDAQIKDVDTAIYGRVTYQMMESYWPTVEGDPNSEEHDKRHAYWVERAKKIVFSKTLDQVTWNNTQLFHGNISAEIQKLKEQPGKDMMIFGSPSLVHEFVKLGLIDKFYININPIILGSGIPYLPTLQSQVNLKLLHSKTYANGVIGLHYQTVR